MLRKKEDEKVLDINATMQGSLVFSEPVNLRINGKFEGTLNTKGNLMVGEAAIVNADIIGEDMVLGGRISGKIIASRMVTLTGTAQFTGDIEAPKIVMEEGAVFNGKCKMPQSRLSLSELSDYLSIEEEKIMEWVGKGKIPVEKEGENLFFDRRNVEDWITQHR
ncbi:MAG: polymer-forming cytoskeletal protein [Candidatus Omnitrophica bacterium]|jgi:cytoskeletal protein CcmA (bactofilin family)|nr:polymer-forming cytoskeletal protein [Candidatus Omnitrophota bacterium]